jgi:hypothetical protein
MHFRELRVAKKDRVAVMIELAGIVRRFEMAELVRATEIAGVVEMIGIAEVVGWERDGLSGMHRGWLAGMTGAMETTGVGVVDDE